MNRATINPISISDISYAIGEYHASSASVHILGLGSTEAKSVQDHSHCINSAGYKYFAFGPRKSPNRKTGVSAAWKPEQEEKRRNALTTRHCAAFFVDIRRDHHTL